MADPANAPYAGWAIVELMGHRQRAGMIAQVEQYGATLLRVDIPVGPQTAGETAGETVTEFYGGGAIYAVRPCDEELARAIAVRLGDPRPVRPAAFRLEPPDGAHPDDDDDVYDREHL